MRRRQAAPGRPVVDAARSGEARVRRRLVARSLSQRQTAIGTESRARRAVGTPGMTLAGKHAVVTGGSRGIGAAIARALQDLGARVTIVHRATVDVADGDAVARAF